MIKKLFAYAGEYKKFALLTPLLVAGEVVLEILIPLIMAELIDKGIDAGNMQLIVKYGVMLVAFAMVALAFGVLSGRTAALGSTGFAKNLRGAMFEHVQDYSFANIDKFSTGSIVTRLTTDVSNLQMAFQMATRMAMRAPMVLIFALVAAFRIDGKLSLIFLAVLPILTVGLFAIVFKVFPIFDKVFKKYDKLNNVVQENLYGMRVVKSFNRQKYETEKFKGASNEIYQDFVRAEKILAFNAPLMQFSSYICMILISWFGARSIVASGNDALIGLSTGELIGLFTYVMQILMSLMIISMIFVMMTMAKASGERILEIIEEVSTLQDPENPIYEVKDGTIDFEDVHFRYMNRGGKEVLNGINLHIPSGLGSSSKMILGSVASALTISNLLWAPYGKLPAGAFARFSILKNCSSSIAFSVVSFSITLYCLLWMIDWNKFVSIFECRPTLTLSSTDILLNSLIFWKVLAIPILLTWAVVLPAVALPFNMILPLVGSYTFVSILNTVVLPAPFGPIRPEISVLPMAIEKSSTAVRPPKSIPSFTTSKTGSLSASLSGSIDMLGNGTNFVSLLL